MTEQQTGEQAGTEQAGEGGGDRLYAGRYKSIEDLEKGYSELQSQFTRQQQQHQDGMREAGMIQAQPDTSVDQILERAGLNAADLSQSFGATGKLTPEQYAALQKVNPGYTPAVVDAFMGAQVARSAFAEQTQAQIQKHAAELAGGQDKLDVLIAWAGRALNERQITDLNRRLADPDLYESAITEITALHAQKTGTAGSASLATGGAPKQGTVAPFASIAEQTAAMADKRYAPKLVNGQPNPNHDPAYYRQVLSRLR